MNSMDMEVIFQADRQRKKNNSSTTPIKIAPPDPYAYKQSILQQIDAAGVSVKDRQKAWQQRQQPSDATAPVPSSSDMNQTSLKQFLEAPQPHTEGATWNLSSAESAPENSFSIEDHRNSYSTADYDDEDTDEENLALRSIQEDDEPSEEPDMEGSWRGREPFALPPKEPLDLPETVQETDHESSATMNSSSNASLPQPQQSSTFSLGVDELVQEIIRQTNASSKQHMVKARYNCASENHQEDDNSSLENSQSSLESDEECDQAARVTTNHGSNHLISHLLPKHLAGIESDRASVSGNLDQESLDPSYMSYTVHPEDGEGTDGDTINNESAGNFGNFFSDEDEESRSCGSGVSGSNDVDSSDLRSLEGHLDEDDNGTSRTEDTELLAAIPPSNHDCRPLYVALDERSVETSGGGSEDLSFFTKSLDGSDQKQNWTKTSDVGNKSSNSTTSSLLGNMLSRVAARQREWSSPVSSSIMRQNEIPSITETAGVNQPMETTSVLVKPVHEDKAAEKEQQRETVPPPGQTQASPPLDRTTLSMDSEGPGTKYPSNLSLRSLKAFQKSYKRMQESTKSKDLTMFRQVYHDDGSVSSAIVEASTDAEQSTKASVSCYSADSILDTSTRSATSHTQSHEEMPSESWNEGLKVGHDEKSHPGMEGLERDSKSNCFLEATKIIPKDGASEFFTGNQRLIDNSIPDKPMSLSSPVVVRLSEYRRNPSSRPFKAGFGVLPSFSDTGSDSEKTDNAERDERVFADKTDDFLAYSNSPCQVSTFTLEDNVDGFCPARNPQQGDESEDKEKWDKLKSNYGAEADKVPPALFHEMPPISDTKESQYSVGVVGLDEHECEEDDYLTPAELEASNATITAAVTKLTGRSQRSIPEETSLPIAVHEKVYVERPSSQNQPSQVVSQIAGVSKGPPNNDTQPVLVSARFQTYLAKRNVLPQPNSMNGSSSTDVPNESSKVKRFPVPILKKPAPVILSSLRAELAPGESFEMQSPGVNVSKAPLEHNMETEQRDFKPKEHSRPEVYRMKSSSVPSHQSAMAVAIDEPEAAQNGALKPRDLEKQCGGMSYKHYVSLIAVIAVTLLAIGLGVGLSRNNESNESTSQPAPLDPSSNPSPSVLRPTQSPSVRTVAPSNPTSTSTRPENLTPQELQLFNLLLPLSSDDGQSMAVIGAPQNQALTWLAGSPNFSSLTDAQKIQRYALATFFYSTEGEQWSVKNLWLSEENECSWFSRSNTPCDGAGSFIDLSLGFNQVGGILPPEIGLLTALQSLSLSGDTAIVLSGTLTSEIGRLTALTTLSLRANALQGPLPASLNALSALEFLDLSANLFSGSITNVFGQWAFIRELDLSSNNLSGALPNLVGFDRLQRLNLSANLFSGPMDESIGQLQSLRELSIGQNLISALSESLGSLPNLSVLAAGENRLSGAVSPSLGASSSLRTVVLRANSFTGTIPTELGQISSLRYLDLSSNNFEGPIPSNIGSLSDLIDLQLHSNLLSGSIPTELSSLIRLGLIRIDDNNITGNVPEEVCSLFGSSLPVFYLDCGGDNPQVTCPPGFCCTYCCNSNSSGDQTCTCLYEGTQFNFLC